MLQLLQDVEVSCVNHLNIIDTAFPFLLIKHQFQKEYKYNNFRVLFTQLSDDQKYIRKARMD